MRKSLRESGTAAGVMRKSLRESANAVGVMRKCELV